MHAIWLIGENLPSAVADGRNEKARLNMQVAATMAGWAFTVAGVGLAHSMAHTLRIMHNVSHGAACDELSRVFANRPCGCCLRGATF